MARRPRFDTPGSWHHVINRGIAHRPMFLGSTDVIFFLTRLEAAVSRGELEIHAWSVLTTHFHLMVRSPSGRMSEGLRRVQNDYTRGFNRLHGRDGSLIRGRFFSKRVDSEAYRRTLVAYIDGNAVQAGLVPDPIGYQWCSAGSHASGERPAWLEGSWIDSVLAARGRENEHREEAYRRIFEPKDLEGRERILMAPPTSTGVQEDVDGLLSAAPQRVRAWLLNKAKLADGRRTTAPVCTSSGVLEALAEAELRHPEWAAQTSSMARTDLRVALLRTLARSSAEEVQAATGLSRGSQQVRLKAHRHALEVDEAYARSATELASDALRRSYC